MRNLERTANLSRRLGDLDLRALHVDVGGELEGVTIPDHPRGLRVALHLPGPELLQEPGVKFGKDVEPDLLGAEQHRSECLSNLQEYQDD